MKPLSIRTLLWGMAIVCLAAVGAALVAQYQYDMRPCPWCILQRVIYVLIALLCIVAASVRGAAARGAPIVGAIVLALLGIASAVYQHVVAAKMYSCNLTLADKIINALGLEQALPAVFQVTATCAEAQVSVLGVPFEYWSLVLFALLAIVAGYLMTRLSER